MIKYVKEIKANADNLTTLMISNIDDDRIEVRSKIEESLKKLIKETLVQKNGEIYIFLTNEEQEINNAINNESVEMGEIIGEASTVIFEEIYTEKNIDIVIDICLHLIRRWMIDFSKVISLTISE